jgi:hypothetical protein
MTARAKNPQRRAGWRRRGYNAVIEYRDKDGVLREAKGKAFEIDGQRIDLHLDCPERATSTDLPFPIPRQCVNRISMVRLSSWGRWSAPTSGIDR